MVLTRLDGLRSFQVVLDRFKQFQLVLHFSKYLIISKLLHCSTLQDFHYFSFQSFCIQYVSCVHSIPALLLFELLASGHSLFKQIEFYEQILRLNICIQHPVLMPCSGFGQADLFQLHVWQYLVVVQQYWYMIGWTENVNQATTFDHVFGQHCSLFDHSLLDQPVNL